MSVESYSFSPVGFVRSPYREKFGVPRQSGLVDEAVSVIEFTPPYDRAEAVRGLEQVSHVWVVFVFHQSMREQWKPTVRPPRLGGNERLGVFATRSPFRPNPIGLSSARLLGIDHDNNQLRLTLAGLDLVDGTPVLDVKPYVAYTDSHTDANSGFASHRPEVLEVVWADAALQIAKDYEQTHAGFIRLVEQVLAQDPRPAYIADNDQREYGMQLYDANVRWRLMGGAIEVLTIEVELLV
ncbi:MAG: tRNA (N6-threonylcarbamoyladenosine(37)-N6)-methyltransferase TrmO [Proteobacteria bacterium]|nr:tRNA (N6-threonylcarbamoyladenosine(37)-N6)-methyltransferase TrmO [Pseudomonadota bacterium]